ncbi:hypothetical protein HELRODRAFT_190425 [Helobdella robusta]|uniref:Calponin-homology (CH) domain-containing protein n=1 Tax=Helobdella robusta TaxID=6412 RepID=T1FRZ5_HELRO|nr:hypothetical protein HELRODRAFT_190425 [Helobdella robusta]ESO10258.1 hypothetical protein HELRODRAFT_190425 [Helobdella robusta]
MANYKAKKAGMNLAEQKKLDEKYDQEEKNGTPERVMVWLNEVLGSDHPKCINSTWRKLQYWMRDGVLLCKFVNKLREAAGQAPVKFQGNAHIPLVAMDNIEAFNKAAVEYGLDSSFTFSSQDLYDGQKAAFCKVIICLHQLGLIANSKSFAPAYKEAS